MKYTISNKETKQGQKGPYTSVTLTNENGEVFDKINLFNGEATDKDEVEGDLVQNGQYWNFKAKVTYTANMPSKGGMVAKAQETKREMIEESQGRKETGIARSGSITNATHLVVAMINAGIIQSNETEAMIQEAVVKYARWYKTMYDNPSSFDEATF